MKDLFGKENDLSRLIGEIGNQWENIGYDIEYKDYPECDSVLEFSKNDEKYIQFIITNDMRVYVNTFDYFKDWQQFTSYEIRLIMRTIEFLEELKEK